MILLIFLLISAATSCKLRARVFSTTTNPVYAQFTFYNGTKSQVYHFERMQQSYGLTLQSPICDLKPTILKSYKNWPVPGVKPIGQTQAFIEGVGYLEYEVNYDRPPQMGARYLVLCGFGDCGVRG